MQQSRVSSEKERGANLKVVFYSMLVGLHFQFGDLGRSKGDERCEGCGVQSIAVELRRYEGSREMIMMRLSRGERVR